MGQLLENSGNCLHVKNFNSTNTNKIIQMRFSVVNTDITNTGNYIPQCMASHLRNPLT